jgi:hypothetical protein
MPTSKSNYILCVETDHVSPSKLYFLVHFLWGNRFVSKSGEELFETLIGRSLTFRRTENWDLRIGFREKNVDLGPKS